MERSAEDYLQFPGLDAELFDPDSTSLLNEVTLRNEALQQVLRKLMLSTGQAPPTTRPGSSPTPSSASTSSAPSTRA